MNWIWKKKISGGLHAQMGFLQKRKKKRPECFFFPRSPSLSGDFTGRPRFVNARKGRRTPLFLDFCSRNFVWHLRNFGSIFFQFFRWFWGAGSAARKIIKKILRVQAFFYADLTRMKKLDVQLQSASQCLLLHWFRQMPALLVRQIAGCRTFCTQASCGTYCSII